MNAKYIICEVKGKGVIPIIFFNDLHKNIYDGLCKVHMSVKVTSAGFVKFKDGTIEAMEGTVYPYLQTYQFHPEMMTVNNGDAKCLFDDFVQAAGGRKNNG